MLLSVVIRLVFIFINYTPTKFKSNDYCLIYHENKNLKIIQKRKKIFLFVNKTEFDNFIHGRNKCTNYHIKYNLEMILHTITDIKVDYKFL